MACHCTRGCFKLLEFNVTVRAAKWLVIVQGGVSNYLKKVGPLSILKMLAFVVTLRAAKWLVNVRMFQFNAVSKCSHFLSHLEQLNGLSMCGWMQCCFKLIAFLVTLRAAKWLVIAQGGVSNCLN